MLTLDTDLIWHYTDFNGLEGILNGTIWASSAAYLNDEREFNYALEIANEVARTIEVATQDPKRQQLITRIIDVLNGGVREQGKYVYVASFSGTADDLGQWRAYGSTFPKFAIGFSKARLQLGTSTHHFNLNEVWYGPDGISPGMKSIFESPQLFAGLGANDAAFWLDRTFEEGGPDVDPVTDAASAVLAVAARAKHPAFKDEKEWRLVRRMSVHQQTAPEVLFRRAGSLIVPYMEIPLHRAPFGTPLDREESPIAAVIIGPSPHANRLLDAVEQLVAHKGLTGVQLISSAVPYRNW